MGKLDLQKKSARVVPALLGRPLLDDDEITLPKQLDYDEHEPIIFSFYEFYFFLTEVVATIFEHNAADLVLVRVKMPSAIALPEILLDERVAIFHDIEVESKYLLATNRDHIVVDTDFKLYSWSASKNTFCIKHISANNVNCENNFISSLEKIIKALPANYEAIELNA